MVYISYKKKCKLKGIIIIEKIYNFPLTNEKSIKKIVNNDSTIIVHILQVKTAAFPGHFSNPNVYMIIANGKMTLGLDSQNLKNFKE